MLVKLLNTNQPSILFLLPFFTGLVWLPFFLNPVVTDSHIVTSYVILFKKDLLMDGTTGTVIAFILTNLTAIFLNRVINNSELTNKPSFIFGFSYVLIESALRSNTGFYSWQISQLLIIASLWPLLQIYNQRSVIHLSFEIGILISIATIFYQPSIIFILIVPVFLQTFRPFNWREWLFPIIGFGMILLFYWTYILIKNEDFFIYYLFEKFNYQTFFYAQETLLIAFGLLTFIGIGSYMTGARRAVIHARKQRLVIVFLFVIAGFTITALNYAGLMYCNYFIVGALSALFIGNYFANARFKWIGEIVFLCVLVLQLVRFNF